MSHFKAALKSFIKDEEGATMVEYGLMLALIAVASIVAVGYIGGSVKALFTTVAGTL